MLNTREVLLNADWQFQRVPSDFSAELQDVPFDNALWETVTLPHTPCIEAYDVRAPWQGICWYQKTLDVDPAWRGKHIVLQFGAAMQIAEVWINGSSQMRHLGGYLPFSIDLTDLLLWDNVNTIAIRLDNRDTTVCPPGKPTNDLDFFYSGGLYRGAKIVVTAPVHVSDAIAAGQEAGGGVFVTYENASAVSATVHLKTHVVNSGNELARNCTVVSRILDHTGALAACSSSEPIMLTPGQGHHFTQTVHLSDPRLWHPDHPYLYSLETTVLQQDLTVDTVSTPIGIRTIHIGNRLLINGEELRICGTNRHQEYPFIGYALSANAQRRDAIKIKEGGFNFVRLAHYPQAPAFLAACDEIGLLVQAPIPGWQIFHANHSFVETSYQNIRDLIRRDRNHPSIIIWEPNFNETDGDHTDWCRTSYEIAHAEYPGDQCYTFGDDYPAGWAGWDVKGLVREYGDWAYGGNESTSRQRRGWGEDAMLQQAWNFQWTLNHLNQKFDDSEAAYPGCASWVMFDHNRGYYPKANWCGMMDIFRLPKFVYSFYQSQRDPETNSDNPNSGPVLFIANYWTPRSSPTKVVVFSNCDEVELFVNGRSIARQLPDTGPDTPYNPEGKINLATLGHDVDMSGGNPFDGGNAGHLEQPPFTFFDVPYEAGELSAIGYRAGQQVLETSVRTPGAPQTLRLEFDTAGADLVSDNVDAIFVHASVVDDQGTVIRDAAPRVIFEVTGPARILGGSPAHAEGGIASALLQAGPIPGAITITATSGEFGTATATLHSRNVG